MSEIKIINTGKCEIIAVIVPDGVKTFHTTVTNFLVSNPMTMHQRVICELPQGKWEIVGIQTELTEEQWREVVPQLGGKLFDGDLNYYYFYPDFLTIDHPFDNKQFDTTKESSLSLLEANQITEPVLIIRKL